MKITKFGGIPNLQSAHAVFRLDKPSFKKEKLSIDYAAMFELRVEKSNLEKLTLDARKSFDLIYDSRPYLACADPEVRKGTGPPPPPPPTSPEISQNLGFLSNTGPDPLKITKLASQHSILRHHRYASEKPLPSSARQRSANAGPIMAR